MNHGKYVFAQISSFLAKRVFDTLVSRYNGDYRVRHFTCWNQLLCMMYGQLSNRDSLSDLVLTVNAHSPKAYHLGFGKGISKANLGKSNTNRDYRIYQDFAYHLIAEARKICLKEDATQFSFSSSVYAFDSTTIDLCLNVLLGYFSESKRCDQIAYTIRYTNVDSCLYAFNCRICSRCQSNG